MIVIIRMVCGTQVAGEVIDETDQGITLTSALELKYNFDYVSGKPVVFLVNFQPFTKGKEHFFKMDIITHVFRDLADDFKTYYEQTAKKVVNISTNKHTDYVDDDLNHATDELTKAMLDYEEQEEIAMAYREILSANTTIN